MERARYVPCFGTPTDRYAQRRAAAAVWRRVLAKPLGRIERAAAKRGEGELLEALSRPPSKAPLWALRALAVSEAAPLGDAAVVEAAFAAVHGDPKKLRASLTSKKDRRPARRKQPPRG